MSASDPLDTYRARLVALRELKADASEREDSVRVRCALAELVGELTALANAARELASVANREQF